MNISTRTTEKQFVKLLENVQVLRKCSTLEELGNFVGICYASDIDNLVQHCTKKRKNMVALLVIDIDKISYKHIGITPVISINSIHDFDNQYFLYIGSKKYTWQGFEPACKLLAKLGVDKFFINDQFDKNYRWINESYMGVEYFSNNIERILHIYNKLEDAESKNTFLSVIKARLEKEIGYFPISPIEEYFHPQVSPEEGDTIVDAGIGNYIEPTLHFAKIVGDKGRVLSFEPSRKSYERAKEIFLKYNNIYLYNTGIYNENTIIDFEETNDDGAHIAEVRNTGCEIVQYKMTSIDNFYKDHDDFLCNFIKFDIEGAEFKALQCADHTIRRYNPKLAICIYHMPCEQLIDICEYLMHKYPQYIFYMLHHSPYYIDTILYGKPR